MRFGLEQLCVFFTFQHQLEYPSHKIPTNLQVLALVLQGNEVSETDGREGDECVVERVDQRPPFLQNRASVKGLAQIDRYASMNTHPINCFYL